MAAVFTFLISMVGGVILITVILVSCSKNTNSTGDDRQIPAVETAQPQASAIPPTAEVEDKERLEIRNLETGGICHLKEKSFAGRTELDTENLIKAIKAQDQEAVLELGVGTKVEQISEKVQLKKLEQKPCQGGVIVKARVLSGPLYPKTFWIPDIYLKVGKP